VRKWKRKKGKITGKWDFDGNVFRCENGLEIFFLELMTEVESLYDYRLDKNLDAQEILPLYYY
jgi:hypothetical protein